ncbi:MAG: hypothetical protein H0T45_02715 [Pyrinomonadaceae bacterium]|nr:hypothetical protein [Pyrinomonadaceae bacterium]
MERKSAATVTQAALAQLTDWCANTSRRSMTSTTSTDTEIEQVMERLNTRPRKTLGFTDGK